MWALLLMLKAHIRVPLRLRVKVIILNSMLGSWCSSCFLSSQLCHSRWNLKLFWKLVRMQAKMMWLCNIEVSWHKHCLTSTAVPVLGTLWFNALSKGRGLCLQQNSWSPHYFSLHLELYSDTAVHGFTPLSLLQWTHRGCCISCLIFWVYVVTGWCQKGGQASLCIDKWHLWLIISLPGKDWLVLLWPPVHLECDHTVNFGQLCYDSHWKSPSRWPLLPPDPKSQWEQAPKTPEKAWGNFGPSFWASGQAWCGDFFFHFMVMWLCTYVHMRTGFWF